MEIRRKLVAGAIGLALVAGGVGCGKVAEKASQKAVEKAIERSSDCEDVSISGDGRVAAECDGETFDIDAGGGAKLPGDWPDELALPEGSRILMSSTTNGTMSVTAGVEDDVSATIDTVTSQLEAAGYTVENESTTDTEGYRSASLQATGEAYDAIVNVVTTASDGEDETSLTYVLSPR